MSVSLREQKLRGLIQAVYDVGFTEGKNNTPSEKGFIVNDALPDFKALFPAQLTEEEVAITLMKIDLPKQTGRQDKLTWGQCKHIASALIGKCATPTFSGGDTECRCARREEIVEFDPTCPVHTEQKEVSACCNAPMTVGGIGDFDDKDKVCTQYYVCTKCKRPCDRAKPIPAEKKEWTALGKSSKEIKEHLAEKKECEQGIKNDFVDLQNDVEKFHDLVKIQVKCSKDDPTDGYMRGMANGLICALAVFKKWEPIYINKPEPKPKDRIEKLDFEQIHDPQIFRIQSKINELVRGYENLIQRINERE